MELKSQNEKSEYGDIPKDWTIKSLNHEIDLLTGFPFPSSHYSRTGIRLLRGSNVKRGVTDWNPEITQYWPKVTSDLNEYVMNEGDIVVAMDGSLVGKSFARLTKNDVPSLLLQRVARIRSTKIDLGYLKEFVCSDFFTQYCDTVKTSSAIPHISPSDIRNFRIPVPPTKSEQTAIATALSDADALIASLEKLIAKKRLIKQGVMQKLLEPKEGWVERKLTDVVTYIHGKAHEQDIVEDGKFVVVNSKFISTEGEVIKYSNISRCTARKHDILTVLSDLPNGKALAKCYYVHENDKYAVNQRICIWRSKGANQKFLFYLLNRNKYFLSLDDGVSQTHILNKHIEACSIKIPNDLSLQEEIGTTLWDIDDELSALDHRLKKVNVIKQGMMQTLLTGKIRLV